METRQGSAEICPCKGEPGAGRVASVRPAEGPYLTLVEFFLCAWAINGHMILFHLVSATSWACESKHVLHLFHPAGEQRHHLPFPSVSIYELIYPIYLSPTSSPD